MKKYRSLVCILMAVALCFCACGAQETSTKEAASDSVSNVVVPAASVADSSQTDEQVLSEAKRLRTACFDSLQGDYNSFAALYRNTPEEVLQNAYQNFALPDFTPDDTITVLVCHEGNYAAVSFVDYVVAGTHPNTQCKTSSMCLLMSYEDGEWKLESSDALVAAIDNSAAYKAALPDGFNEAWAANRNAVNFDAPNYAYLSTESAYHGCLKSDIKFAWQNEDGSVGLAIVLANGTDANVYYGNATATLTDNSLGTLVESQFNVDAIVSANSSAMYTFEIPADQVRTGMQTWGSVHSNFDVSWK